MSYQAGDVVNGSILSTDGTWHPVESPQGDYRVGDVANGYVLTTDNQWRPVEQSQMGNSPTATAVLERSAPPAATSTVSKPFYRRWWFMGGAGLLLVVIIASAANSGTTSTSVTTLAPVASPAAPVAPPAAAPPSTPATVPSAAQPAPAVPASGLNTPVRDGDFEFTVTKMECGKSKIGGQYLTKTAQGQFCLASMTVTNIGKESQMFSGSSQKAFDAQGRELEADGGAAMYLEDSKSFLEDINPGNSVQGTVVYDIPKASKIVELELHDSFFSGGARVKVA